MAAIHLDRVAHRPRIPIQSDQIGDKLPLLATHIAVHGSPGLRRRNHIEFPGTTYAITDP